MSRAAASELPGAAPPGGCARPKSGWQPVVPSELMQTARMLARAKSLPVSTFRPAARVGGPPVAVLASSWVFRKALARPVALVAELPMFPFRSMKGESAQAVAAVVTSLMFTEVEGPRLPQLPSAATISSTGLFLPEPSPGLPPCTVM
jgi:hypothetical protein